MITRLKTVTEMNRTPSGAILVRAVFDGTDGEESHFLKFDMPPNAAQIREAAANLIQSFSPVLAPLPMVTPTFAPKTWYGKLALWAILKLHRWVR